MSSTETTIEKKAEAPLEESFEWLKLELDRLPQKETLEYSFKKSLIAASAVFTLEKNLSGETLNVEGQLKAKIPFKGNFEFEATSASHRNPSPIGFSIYKEFKSDDAIRLWIEQAGVLKCIPQSGLDEAKTVKDFSVGETLPAGTVLNALTLLSVLSSHLPSKKKIFAAQFVAADKLFVLKILFDEAGTRFRVFSKEAAAPVSSEQWQQINWPEASLLEGNWSAEHRAVNALRVRVPVLGALELPLTRSSRE